MSLSSSFARVYTGYDIDKPPEHPGSEWTRFVCVSDTHSRIVPVPPGDVLLHAGDLSSHGRIQDLEITVNWLKSLPHSLKIIIAGNHDWCLDRSLGIFSAEVFDAAHNLVAGEAARESGICYLEYQTMEISLNGYAWKVYGSPAAPRYVDGAFQYTTPEAAQDIYRHIPSDVNILLTHTPPYGIHDFSGQGNHAGCPVLANRLQAVDSNTETTRCRLHVWGHIHEARNASISPIPRGERVHVNAAIRREYPPIIVDLRHMEDTLHK